MVEAASPDKLETSPLRGFRGGYRVHSESVLTLWGSFYGVAQFAVVAARRATSSQRAASRAMKA